MLRVVDDAFPHLVVTNETLADRGLALDELRENVENDVGQLALRIERIEEDLRLVVKRRLRWFEAVADPGDDPLPS